MLTRKQQNQALGIGLILAGILVAFAADLGFLVLLGAAAAVVAGLVLLVDTRRHDKSLAVGLLAIGALLLLSDRLFHAFVQVVHVALAVLLILAGVWILRKGN